MVSPHFMFGGEDEMTDPKPYVPLTEIEAENEDHSNRVIHENSHKDLPAYKAVIDPSTMSFGNIEVGATSAHQTGTVRNTGYKPLAIVSITSVGEYLVSNNAPLVLQPGATFQISVAFTPQFAGIATGGIYVDTGDAVGQKFIALTGNGVTP